MESCTIRLTPAAHKHGNLYLSHCGKDFFPEDSFGESSAKKGPGTPVTLKVYGLESTISTDIAKDKKIFRQRGWVKKFVKVNNLNMNDTIIINRIAPRQYLIAPDKTTSDLVTPEEAARIIGKTPHNIRDYIQRGRIHKYNKWGARISKANNGELRVSLKELTAFLDILEQDRQRHHCPGQNEELGFYGLPEYERTKHVHRLHPYLGKFIPQLVEWFLARYFKEDDIILDPFMG